MEKGECFDFNHSLGCVYPTLYIVRLQSRVYHFSLQICYRYSFIKRFANIFEFCNGDIYKFISLLRKYAYPYEYMDSWKRFDETSLPDRKGFYVSLNMGHVTHVDYRHAKRAM